MVTGYSPEEEVSVLDSNLLQASFPPYDIWLVFLLLPDREVEESVDGSKGGKDGQQDEGGVAKVLASVLFGLA